MGLFDRFKRKSKDAVEDDDDDGLGEGLLEDLKDVEIPENRDQTMSQDGVSDDGLLDDDDGLGRVAPTDDLDIRSAVAETLDHLESNTSEEEDGDESEQAPRIRYNDDDDDDEDDEEQRSPMAAIAQRLPKGRAGLIAVAAGAFLMVSVLTGGIAWLLIDSGDAPVAEEGRGTVVGLALPPPPSASGLTPPVGGGLNAFGVGDGSESTAAQDAGLTLGYSASDANGSAGQTADGNSQSGVPNPDGDTVEAEGLNAFAVPGGAARQAGADITVTVTSSAAFDIMLDQGNESPLRSEPDPDLIEPVDGGVMVPRIFESRTPFDTYSRPANPPEGQPRIAIIVVGLGHSRAATEAAILKLPGEVSLSFDVYANDLESWLGEAWVRGHEVLLSMPMESETFPNEDAGPLSLRTELSVANNIIRLNAMMGRFRGFIGMQTVMGSKFMADETQMTPILETLKGRGLMIFESTRSPRSLVPRLSTELGLARAFTDVEIDVSPSKTAIDAKLQELETLARQRGAAVGLTHALPSALERLAIWIAATEQRGISIVPISSIAGARVGGS